MLKAARERRNYLGSDFEVSPCEGVGYTETDRAVKKPLFNVKLLIQTKAVVTYTV